MQYILIKIIKKNVPKHIGFPKNKNGKILNKNKLSYT